MNANRRLEEFILKLSTRKIEHSQLDQINEIKLKIKSNFDDIQTSKGNLDNNNCHQSPCIIYNK
jgi:hypothetical protein